MKKIYLSLLTCIGFCSLHAQVTLTQANHAPVNGDNYHMYRCDSVSPGNSGAGQLWDFSALTTHSNNVVNYNTLSTTSANYPGATISVFSSTADISYYDSDVSSLRFYGGSFGVSTVNGTITYTSPAIRAAYPMSFNTTSTSAIAGSINVTSPATVSGPLSGTSSVLADGTGTLILQGTGNTFTNVLRVKTTQAFTFTTSFTNGSVQQETYDYYAQGLKFSLLTIATATVNTPLTGVITQTIVMRDKTPGITSVLAQTADAANYLNVYPNPANTHVNFASNYPDAKFVSVFDITGKLITKINMEDGKAKLDVSSLQQGLYLYTVSDADQKALKSGKLTVTH